jgi:hypothetical protein
LLGKAEQRRLDTLSVTKKRTRSRHVLSVALSPHETTSMFGGGGVMYGRVILKLSIGGSSGALANVGRC